MSIGPCIDTGENMALVKPGQGITDIRGGLGGVYFTRDKSGLHCTAKPRRVHQITDAQRNQRNAFIGARTYSKDNRVVSYLMYRYMNGLPLAFPPTWILPVDFIDIYDKWSDERNAFDDNNTTFASSEAGPLQIFQRALDFVPRVPIPCTAIRYNARHRDAMITEIRCRIWYKEVSEIVYQGDFPNHFLTEVAFDRVDLSKLSIQFKTISEFVEQKIYEIAFYVHANPVDGSLHYPVPADYQIPKL